MDFIYFVECVAGLLDVIIKLGISAILFFIVMLLVVRVIEKTNKRFKEHWDVEND